jgi:hypothetical protein
MDRYGTNSEPSSFSDESWTLWEAENETTGHSSSNMDAERDEE